MKKEMPKMKVIDLHTGQSLFECSIEESEKAYQFASSMEELGLDIKVIAPTLGETLSNSLGLSPLEIAAYQESLVEESEQHEGSCCFENPDPNKPLN